jgi:gamma-glutamyl:cysteine ligase YbdK (ATP-grasp superfamily)
MKKTLGLFEAYGIELEYMIVDRTTLKILPITDRILERMAGNLSGDFENGRITWSNELVLHVIEIKTTGPDKNLRDLAPDFQKNIQQINGLLAAENAMLLPTGMHPFMEPNEKRLWPHDNNEIYEIYDKIFDCRGHGWSNLQSMHINLPFANDEEFRRLHTAIRFLLPVLPALTASSPIKESKTTGYLDSRLLEYQQNQKRIPSITGLVIPEPVQSKQEYHDVIFKRVWSDIAPFDTEEMLREEWLNSRGAIARFDRDAIEIRILDTQECPAMDIAIAALVSAVLKKLTDGAVSFDQQIDHSTEDLKNIFDASIKDAEVAMITDTRYLRAWGLPPAPLKNQDFWKAILTKLKPELSDEHSASIRKIIEKGSLATRILNRHQTDSIETIYRDLARCLEEGAFFS